MTHPLIALRPATKEDAKLLWEWVNDPQVRANSFNSGAISWQEHVSWFSKKLQDPHCRIFIGMFEGVPAGQIRFDRNTSGSAEIAISMDARFRGRGFGLQLVRLGCTAARQQLRPVARFTARVKAMNKASQRLFEKAAFASAGENWVLECKRAEAAASGSQP